MRRGAQRCADLLRGAAIHVHSTCGHLFRLHAEERLIGVVGHVLVEQEGHVGLGHLVAAFGERRVHLQRRLELAVLHIYTVAIGS